MVGEPFPEVRQACRDMMYDSCGQNPSRMDIVKVINAALLHFGAGRMRETETFLLYLDNDAWFVCLWFDGKEAAEIAPPRVDEVLNWLLDHI